MRVSLNLPALLAIEPTGWIARCCIAVIASFAFLALAFLSFQERSTNPSWGISTELLLGGRMSVSWVQPGGLGWDAGIRPGDVIVEADGRAIDPADSIDFDSAETLRTVNGTRRKPVSVDSRFWADPALAVSLLVVAVAYLVLGTVVLLWAPNLEHAVAFYAVAASIGGIVLLGISVYTYQLWIVRLQFGMVMLASAAVAYFFLVFPRRRFANVTRVIRAVVFLPPILAVLLFAVSSAWWPAVYEAGRPVAAITNNGLGLIGLGCFAWSYMESRKLGSSQQLTVPVVGTAMAFLVFMVLAVVSVTPGIELPIPSSAVILLIVLMPASFTYAILRHRLLGISSFVRRGLISAGVWASLLMACLALSVGSAAIFDPEAKPDWLDLTTQGLFVALAAAILPTLHRLAQRFIDRLFFRDVYHYGRALESLGEIMASAQSADELASRVLDVLAEIMHLSLGAVALRSGSQPSEVIASLPHGRLNVVKEIEANADALLDAPNDGSWPRRTIAGTRMMFIPLVSAGHRTGFLCLGPKEADAGFTQRDVNLLSTLSVQAAVALDNARLLRTVQRNLNELRFSAIKLEEGQKQLQELNRRLLMAEEKERKRIAADLHDDPLQRIMLLLRHVDSCPGVRRKQEAVCRTLASEAAAQLRRVCADFHPPLLEDLGLGPALEWLVDSVAKSTGLSARLVIDEGTGNGELSEEVQIALFRVAQESLNNAARHSGAATVQMLLSRHPNSVSLSIADDGRGFSLPDSLSELSVEGHMGLIGMRERMLMVGGKLEIYTAPGQGTEVVAVAERRGSPVR
ncbi:MAG: GAF domain-containing protein [Chloroflexi bacterium]|nr:GAF domain-containing protein [Chloroflexota bacterium]